MRSVCRPILEKIKKGFRNNRIIIIVGSRQTGKTTVMKMYIKNVKKHYRSFYFNLEDIGHLKICQNAENLFSYLRDKAADVQKDKIFLIIDEFHYINNATKLFKLIYDLYPNVKILASGSSSIEIQKHLKESLAGRKRVYNLYPLSFEEFVRFKSEDKYSEYQLLNFKSVSDILIDDYNKKFFGEYILYGGYPKVALIRSKEEKIEELKDIYSSYIQKDIKSLIKGEDISAYNNLLAILSSQIGNLLNINELSNTLGLNRRKILQYLTVLKETFIIYLLKPFSSNKRIEISKMPKIYLLDTGIANFSINNFSPISYRSNLGSYIENYVLTEIIKFKPIQYHLYFWRTKVGTEVDFILSGNGELIPIEVKWQNVSRRPLIPKNLISFIEHHQNIKRAVIATKNFTKKTKYKGKQIYFIPAVLLNKFIKGL